MGKRKRRNKKIILISSFFILVLMSALISFKVFSWLPTWDNIFSYFGLSDNFEELNKYELKVSFFDVGKADSILIDCGDNDILIDAGYANSKIDLVQSIKKQNVEKFDMIVNSHPDKDHIGQMDNIIYSFPVDKFITSDIPEEILPSSNTYEKMVYAINNKNIPVKFVKYGDDLSIGNMKINVIAPVKQYDTTNNNSVVLKLTYGNDKMIFMGDAEKEAEKDILSMGEDLQSDLIKIGHHGSKSSTTQDLIDSVLPKIAIISVGEDKNNLPKQEILDRLTNNNVKIFRTDLSGNITAVSNGNGIKIFEGIPG